MCADMQMILSLAEKYCATNILPNPFIDTY